MIRSGTDFSSPGQEALATHVVPRSLGEGALTTHAVGRSRPARRRHAAWVRGAAIAAIALSSFTAHGQPSATDRRQAEALFGEGKKLLKEGKTAEACRKFEASYRIDPAGGTVLNLALCHEKEGKIASAWAELKEALAAAKKASRRDREKIAREKIEAIEPRLPYVVVIPEKQDTAGLTVVIDEGGIAREAWGAQIPIDPGPHTAKATAPNHDPWEAPFEVAEGKKVTVRVPGLVARAAPTATASSSAAPVAEIQKYPWMRPSGIALASVGVAAAVAGAVFGVRALSLGADAKKGCDASLACSDAGLAAVQEGRFSATAADILLGAGGGVAVMGLVLIIAGGATQPAGPVSGRPRVTPVARVSMSGATLGVEGAW